ncbi:helix-turn-helix transcriptional regulator [Pseudonocardia xinjiangensis]|uniref:Helix-turn-helix transcriptional regulator n=1 Tax=Pseudonocardia xinjiangensis TaxID=75289 RepID=A0ABX1RAW6_9PSEU|nr:helix-turn-helix transcriptional regulator [Pseudonocardia xinjiangensis]
MEPGSLIAVVRHRAQLSQGELAERAGTSRPTLSSYEHGHRSPTLSTAARILAAADHELTAVPIVRFEERTTRRGRTIAVPSHLPRLPPAQALATVRLPLHLHWSAPRRSFDLRDRAQRARVYEIVLREGGPMDVLTYVDGVLLTELWPDLVLPREVRAAWATVVDRAMTEAA